MALKNLLPIVLMLALSSCGAPMLDQYEASAPVLKGAAPFTGVWKVTLKVVQDGCKLGRKSVPATITIQQNGKRATLSISGLPNYKGTINGKTLTAKGTYDYNPLKLTGSVTAVLSGRNKIKVSTAKLTIKQTTTSCSMKFSGSGTKS